LFNLVIILGIYFFVLIGFVAKRSFKEIDEKTLILISIYFLQPMLAFWGIFTKPFEVSDIAAPAWYFVISIIGAGFGFLVFRLFFKDKKDIAIITAGGVIGNTGNLGLPLLVGIYGKSIAFYAVLINTANVFVLYIIGVFLYSLGSVGVRESIKNIFKIPVIWFSLLAIILNIAGVKLHPAIEHTVEMGAYASMTLQLIVFGVFIGGLNGVNIDIKVLFYGLFNKLILIPLLAFVVLYFSPLEPFLKAIVFLQVCMPLAIGNVNLASLYGCKPHTVTALILFTSVAFLGAFFLYADVFDATLSN